MWVESAVQACITSGGIMNVGRSKAWQRPSQVVLGVVLLFCWALLVAAEEEPKPQPKYGSQAVRLFHAAGDGRLCADVSRHRLGDRLVVARLKHPRR